MIKKTKQNKNSPNKKRSCFFLHVPMSMREVYLSPTGRVGKPCTRSFCLPPSTSGISGTSALAPLHHGQDFFVDGLEGALPFLTLGVSRPREPWPCSCPESTSPKLRHPRCIGVEISWLSSSDSVWRASVESVRDSLEACCGAHPLLRRSTQARPRTQWHCFPVPPQRSRIMTCDSSLARVKLQF